MQPIVLVPGLLCSAEVFVPQVAALWPFGPVTVASTLEGKTMSEIAANNRMQSTARCSSGSPGHRVKFTIVSTSIRKWQ